MVPAETEFLPLSLTVMAGNTMGQAGVNKMYGKGI
jgi:hypothetical protein